MALLPQNASLVEYAFLACKSGGDALSQTLVLGYLYFRALTYASVSLYWLLLAVWKPSHSFPGHDRAAVIAAQLSMANKDLGSRACYHPKLLASEVKTPVSYA